MNTDIRGNEKMSRKIIDAFADTRETRATVFVQGRIPKALYDQLLVEFEFIRAQTGKKVSWPKFLGVLIQRFVEEAGHERLSTREPKEKRSGPATRRA